MKPKKKDVENAADAKQPGDAAEDADMKTTKKTGSFQGKSNAPGGGGRFAQMTAKGVSPALAAYIGRKKFGSKMMAHMAAKGK